jgi:predicted methyltransferase
MIKHLLCIASALLLCQQTALAGDLNEAVDGDHRTKAYTERDKYRHPVATLAFFDVQPDHKVVEIAPGGGWYTEILAPYLRAEGLLYAAHFPKETDVAYYIRGREAFLQKLKGQPEVYDKVVVTEFGAGVETPIAPANSADRVLTFRNLHNWLEGGFAEEAFDQFYTALKPGGILGVVEHRAKPGTSLEQMRSSGYVTEAKAIELATQAGFKLVSRSDINANPKDTADHPKGVWTLPPSLGLGDEDRAKYLAIGESDRMTLKFQKPAL